MGKNNGSAIITGITIGLGIGAAVAILFAPQSGKDTREDLMGIARDRINQTKKRISDMGDRVRDVKDRFSDVVDSGKEFTKQVQDSVENVKGHIHEVSEAGQKAYRAAAKSA